MIFSFQRKRMDRELAEEIRQHLEWKTRQNMAAGMADGEARHAARRQLGNPARVEEESRENRGFPLLESLLQDVRYGLRGLRQAPGFTAVAAITLALSIGATTAIFSIVNTILVRPLPYKDSRRIANIRTVSPMFPEFSLGESKPDYDDIRAGTHVFEQLAMFQQKQANLTGMEEPEQIATTDVSAEFLPLLGVAPALGRGFTPEDSTRKNGDVVLLGHGLWRRRFESDAKIVGKQIMLEHTPRTVIGVLPEGFDFPRKSDAWLPLLSSTAEAEKRGARFYSVLAKLRPGIGLAAAQAELDNLAARLSTQYSQDDSGIQLKLTSLQEDVTGSSKSGLVLLLGAVGFLLLIACANVSNLVLSRGARRQQEIAVRAALGASRRRILRQLLVESLLLSFLGGAAGLLVAVYSIDAFRIFAPSGVPRLDELRVDVAMAWIALAISSVAGILSGLAPALRTSRPDLNLALKERVASGTAAGAGGISLRGFLVAAEIALALVLLDGSALMVQSLLRTLRVDAGFRTDHVLTAELNLPASRYATPEARTLFIQQLLDALHANPQLQNAALSDSSALTDNLKMMMFDAGTLGEGDNSTTLQMRSVAPGYFDTLRIRLVSGRTFNANDVKGGPGVAIINESLARRYFSGQNPLGKVLRFGREPNDQSQIVGVVGDTRDVHLQAKPRPQIYLPLLRNPEPSIHIFIRSTTEPLALANTLRKTVWAIDKDQPLSRVQTMDQIISQSVAEPRFRTWLLGVFAVAGLALTLVGIYGVVSYTAGQRTREIGIRIALGAQPGAVLRLVLGQGIRLAGAGALAGIAGALALTRLLKSQLYEIKPADPGTLIAAAALMFLVALAACYLPARRAARVDPLIALRHE
jgi:putative ABC transport system permease protein